MPPVMLILLMLSIAGVLIALRRERAGRIAIIVASVELGALIYTTAGHNQLAATLIYAFLSSWLGSCSSSALKAGQSYVLLCPVSG